MADKLQLSGGFWTLIASLDGNFSTLGYLIIDVFLASWLLSIVADRRQGADAMEVSSGQI